MGIATVDVFVIKLKEICSFREQKNFLLVDTIRTGNLLKLNKMKLILKIVLLTLLFLFKYQSIDAEAFSSSIDKSSSTIGQGEQSVANHHLNNDTVSYSNDLVSGNQQVVIKLIPDDARIRRAEEHQQDFLKILIDYFSLREDSLALGKAKMFPSNPIHCVSPACHYFVFTLRRILI